MKVGDNVIVTGGDYSITSKGSYGIVTEVISYQQVKVDFTCITGFHADETCNSYKVQTKNLGYYNSTPRDNRYHLISTNATHLFNREMEKALQQGYEIAKRQPVVTVPSRYVILMEKIKPL